MWLRNEPRFSRYILKLVSSRQSPEILYKTYYLCILLQTLNYILKIINRQSVESRNRPLNSTETIILQGIWQYQTYTQMAIEAGYSPGYFTTVVAPELYQKLSELIGQPVSKKNCRRLLESYVSESSMLDYRFN